MISNNTTYHSEDYGEPIQSRAIKAGRRTYFIDVRNTRDDDYYLTITESRKKSNGDGSFSYDRHKIFLYKEDFDKLSEGLEDAINFIKASKPENFINESNKQEEGSAGI